MCNSCSMFDGDPLTQLGRVVKYGNRLAFYDSHFERVYATFTTDGKITKSAVSSDGRAVAVGDAAGRVIFLRVDEE